MCISLPAESYHRRECEHTWLVLTGKTNRKEGRKVDGKSEKVCVRIGFVPPAKLVLPQSLVPTSPMMILLNTQPTQGAVQRVSFQMRKVSPRFRVPITCRFFRPCSIRSLHETLLRNSSPAIRCRRLPPSKATNLKHMAHSIWISPVSFNIYRNSCEG